MNQVMTFVIKIVNNVRAHSLKRRQFKQLAEEMDCQYGDLLLHNEVRWLSRGKVLQRFNEVLPVLVTFFKNQGEPYPELENPEWLQDFAFLVDITEKLNDINTKLQGKDKCILEMLSEVTAFSIKLKLFPSLFITLLVDELFSLILGNKVVTFCILDYRAPAKDLQIIGVARGPKRLATPDLI
uniref:General transcription factor II-I repeat domain-containing protein 2 n=1 Tax=Cacopsylla melanoneura TaxID=428564 RepID=A0A8D9BI68_9HEMI